MSAKKKTVRASAKEPDWKKIAHELARRCVFVATYIRDASGSGLVMNMKTGKAQHWRDYVADGIEMMPGVTVDRDMLHAQALPRSRRAKAIREIKERRERGES